MLSLDDYLLDMFIDPPGYYRFVGLTVTGQAPALACSPRELSWFGAIPRELQQLTLAGRTANALVYTFERVRCGELRPGYPDSPPGLTHLKTSGLYGLLERKAK